MIALGMMSGTSLDGIDAALVEIHPDGEGYALRLLAFETSPFDASLAALLRGMLPPAAGTVEDVARAHRALGDAFATAARRLATGERIDYVATHGQTIWHDGERCVTLQIADPFALREALGVTVCFDFRSADCAAGGHGAPLVPHVDRMLFAVANEDRVTLNLGGIANITLLPRDGEVTAFDTGPGNMLLDAFVAARSNGALSFDRDGALAARGRVDEKLLAALASDPYFAQPPPKSTGRERFGQGFLQAHAALLDACATEDGAATLTELTAVTVAEAIHTTLPSAARTIVSGGGASNPVLLERLRARLSGMRVETSDAMGIPPDAKEAIAFAILGYETLRERPANLPSVTGARRAVPLGAIAAHDLRGLLARIETECRSS